MKKKLGVLLCFLGCHKADKKATKLVSYDRYSNTYTSKCLRCQSELIKST